MADKTDAMRERYDRFIRGDVEGALDLWSDDFVWEASSSTDLPGGGRHEGKDAAVQALQDAVGSWDSFALSADEFFEDGDTVVVLGHNDVSKGSNSARIPVVHVWRWRGDQVIRLQLFTDTYQGAQILGLA